MVVEAMMKYPIILKLIFENLSRHELRKCRLVCKLWNVEAKKLLRNILIPIFELLPTGDLQNCRLVSKSWDKAARIVLRSKFQITFKDISDIQRFNEEIPKPSNFCWKIRFEKNILLSDENVQRFLNRYGSSISHMELIRAKWNISLLQNLLHRQLVNLSSLRILSGVLANPDGDRVLILQDNGERPKILPYMKKLTLDMVVLDKRKKVRVGVEEFLLDLFKICPRLEWFWCSTTSIYTRTYIHNLITRSDVFRQLTFLGTIIDFDTHRLRQLQPKCFPLKKLYLRIGNVDFNVLHSFLVSLKTTLVSLAINYEGSVVRKLECAKKFPSSKELQKLEILELVCFTGTLDFLEDFRNLNTLILKEINWTKQFPFSAEEIFPHSERFKCLRELIFVKVEHEIEFSSTVKQFEQHGNIKYSNYADSDQFYYDYCNHDKKWEEFSRDINHFPFS